MMALFEAKDLSKFFGGLAALSGVDLRIDEGEIIGLIGPNGAGKTTFFNVISGYYPPNRGRIFFQGRDITGLRPDKVARYGIVRTFQGNRLFQHRTVMENVILGHHLCYRTSLWGGLFRTPGNLQEEGDVRSGSLEILDKVGLIGLKDEYAINLPHGFQRLLGMAIALAARPQLLLLDEPATGLNPEERTVMMNLIRRLCDEGLTIILVEHTMQVVMGICDRIVVLSFGRKIAEGTPAEIQKNETVVEAYLGSEDISYDYDS